MKDGVLELLVNIGDAVSQNDLVALIHHPQTPWKDVDEVRTPYGGMILCKRALGQVERGDAVFQVAKDVET